MSLSYSLVTYCLYGPPVLLCKPLGLSGITYVLDVSSLGWWQVSLANLIAFMEVSVVVMADPPLPLPCQHRYCHWCSTDIPL